MLSGFVGRGVRFRARSFAMRIRSVIFGLACCLSMVSARGQQVPETVLPENPAPAIRSPTPQVATKMPPDPEPAVGDSLFAPIATGTGPESLAVKTESYVVATFGPRALIAPAFSAAIRMARPPSGYPREWIDGGPAFGRNYGASLGERVASETARYGVGALLHEDFRYRPSTGKGIARVFHAIGYAFVDESDSGHRRLAVANFADAAAGGFVGNLYLPDGYNSPGDGARHFATRFAGMAGTNVSREFAPEIFALVQKLHVPFPHTPLPEWWTKNGWVVSRRP
jgi:hypothetical protein